MSEESSLEQVVFDFLRGDWLISRTFSGSYEGRLTGEARFTSDGEGYLYEESGNLETADGQQFGSRQQYLYRLGDGMIEVLKQENGEWLPLHELRFKRDETGIHATHLHLCGEDRYSVVYEVDLDGGFQVSYTIYGPKKDYIIQSEYKRP